MSNRKATIVVGLGFGDEGKGTTVDYLARQNDVSAVVRFNGGAQAAHNVVTPDGKHHTFQQFGSASFLPRVRTHHSRFMVLDPLALANEAKHLAEIGCGNVFARLSVDEQALVVSPFHKAANRIREVLRAKGKHGSVGMGVGETVGDSIAFPEYALHARDLRDRAAILSRFKFFQNMKQGEFREHLSDLASNPHIQEEVKILADPDMPALLADLYYRVAMRFPIVDGNYLARLAREGSLIFEGAQGVLLDEWYGFHPYTTWSTTTFRNALTLLREIGYEGHVEKLGVLRAYSTRHGAGPFPTEDPNLGMLVPELHNGIGPWQGGFRIGWPDLVLARYALAVAGGADALAITHLDRFMPLTRKKVAVRYQVRDTTVATLQPKEHLTDLVYQEQLMGLVSRATPQYEDIAPGEAAYLQFLERRLCVPIALTSHGMTYLDKRSRSMVRAAA